MGDVLIIGNAIVDVMANPVNEKVFSVGSIAVDSIRLAYGGDALNEAVILSKLGSKVGILTKVGDDDTGTRIRDYLANLNVDTENMIFDSNLETSVNIVFVDEKGERHFITNPNGSQRHLSYYDILPLLKEKTKIISLASMFISPALDIEGTRDLFRHIKENLNCIISVDMTKAKFGEKIADLKEVLPFVDYIFPNEEEIELLTDESLPEKNIKILMEMGVKCPVIKCGNKGCIIGYKDEIIHIPAYEVEKCIDTTGAGDSFVAGFLWALLGGWQIKDCGAYACAVGSCAVEELGSNGWSLDKEKIFERFNRIKSRLE